MSQQMSQQMMQSLPQSQQISQQLRQSLPQNHIPMHISSMTSLSGDMEAVKWQASITQEHKQAKANQQQQVSHQKSDSMQLKG